MSTFNIGNRAVGQIMANQFTDKLSLEDKLRDWSCPELMSGCFIWLRCVDTSGYGQVSKAGRQERAHRVAWQLHNGCHIPDGMHVIHKCDNRLCVNPRHLELGTVQSNNLDKTKKGRGVKSKTGLPYGAYQINRPGCKPRYRAGVRFERKMIYLGYFDSPEEASAVAIEYKQGLYA